MLEGMQGVSTFAADIERANIVIYGICIFLFVVVIGTMFVFLFKYSAKRHKPEDTANIKHHTGLEITWTVVPFILMMICFYYGVDALRAQRTMPENGIEIKVVAKKWSWSFEYANGKKTSKLYVPINENIKLSMTAPKDDVTHSFYVPAFRTKEDVIPGKTTKLWFNANTKGNFDIECAEYCGTGHSFMLSHVKVIDKKEYDEWYNSDAATPGASTDSIDAMGVLSQKGCLGCHSTTGTSMVGPSFKGIYNRKVKVGGVEILSDETYLLEAINKPNAKIVDGYTAGIMPSYETSFSKEELKAVMDLFKKGF